VAKPAHSPAQEAVTSVKLKVGTSTKDDLNAGIDAAIESIVNEAVRSTGLLLVNGPPGLINLASWWTAVPSRAETEKESIILEHVAERIRKQSEQAILSMFVGKSFRRALIEDSLKGWGLAQARRTTRKHSDPFRAVMRANPDASTKVLLKLFERGQMIEDIGPQPSKSGESRECYRVIATGRVIAKSSLSSKISRLRKDMG